MFSGDVFFVACFRKLGCGLLFAFHSNARLGFSARLGFFYKNAQYKFTVTDFCYIHSPTGDRTAFDAITGCGHCPNIAITFGTEKTRMVVYHAGGERRKHDDYA